MNIDKYLKQVNNNPLITTISLANPIPTARVIQCVAPLKTVVPLNELKGAYQAHFPRNKPGQASFCLAINRLDNGRFGYAQQLYNPQKDRSVRLPQLEELDESQLYDRLKKLSAYTGDLKKLMEREKERIARELTYRNRLKAIEQLVGEQRSKMETMNRLREAIDPCTKGKGKAEERPIDLPVKVRME